MAVEIKTPSLPVIKPKAFEPQVLPKEVAEREFSSNDPEIEIEQLPAHGPADSDETEGAPTPQPVKIKDKTKEENTKEEPETEGGEEEGEDSDDVSEIPSVLKAPVAKKEAEVKEEEDSEEHEESAPIKPIAPPAKKKVIRDYSGYTEQQVAAFKKMSDEAYEYTTGLIKENNTLKRSSYLQHPDAYRISPEYSQAVTTYQRASQEQQYWESQLEAMENGQPLTPFQGWDNRTGQPVFGDPMEPTIALKNRVQQAILACSQESNRVKKDLQEYPNKYKSQIQEGVRGIEDFRANTFAWVKDPSMEDHTLNIEGVGERSLRQIRQDVTTMLPNFLQGSPLAPLIQDLVISVRILQAEKAAMSTKTKVSNRIKEESDLVEPSGRGKPSVPSRKEKVHGVSEFRVDPDLGI